MALDESIYAKLEAACSKARVTLWTDVPGEYAADVAGLELPGVEVIVVDGNELAAKRRVLRDEPGGRFLLYRAGEAPARSEDFLLDVEAFARPFSATQAASWAEEVGLPPSAAGTVSAHAEFFRAAARREALRDLLASADWAGGGRDEGGLLLAMVAACFGVRDAHLTDAYRSLARRLLGQWALGREEGLRLAGRCNLEGALWGALRDGFGYESEEPGAEDFALEVMLTACSDLTGEEPPLSPDAARVLADMAGSPREAEAYAALIDRTCDYVAARCDLASLPLETLASHRYLPAVDYRIVRSLAADVSQCVDVASRVADLRARRAGASTATAWAPAYDALEAASALLSGEKGARAEAKAAESAAELLGLYAGGLCGLDAAYRRFRAALPAAAGVAAGVFGPIASQAEVAYARFANDLASSWQALVMGGHAWPPAGTPAYQGDFYRDRVRVALGEGRVAVVVSDALRYEAAAEWAGAYAARGRAAVEVEPMLSALPSYTQLGMAALLPHGSLAIDPGTLAASADGRDATGAANRQAILESAVPGAVAIPYADAVTREGAERLGAAPLAYVYHNVIDATGDKRDSEGRAFSAVNDALKDLDSICDRLIRLGFRTVFVTADHGFLYQEDPSSFECADVDLLGTITSDESARHSRRFVAAKDLPKDGMLMELTASQLGLEGDYEVGIPKGTRRLRLKGSGARFVHGGMTLQETVVPCVRLRAGRSAGPAKPVSAQIIAGGTKVIGGGTLSFEVYQSDPVGGSVAPSQMRVALYDGGGRRVSEERPLSLSSPAESPADRMYPVTLAVDTAVPNGATLTLRLERRHGSTSKYETVDEKAYRVRRNFGMDF